MSKEFITDIQVRFRDLDSMGHVNNAVFFTYFEMGRVAFFLKNADHAGPRSFSFILAHISCDYVKPVTSCDRLSLRMSVTHIGRKSFSLSYLLCDRKDWGSVYARGESVQVTYDYEHNRSVPISEAFRDQLAHYFAGESA